MQIEADRRRVKRRQLFSYRAKVLAGMAAALTVLFLVPADGAERADMPQNSIFGSLLYEKADEGGDWEEEAARRQQDIDRTWERYREGQERADARQRYFRDIADKIKDNADWED